MELSSLSFVVENIRELSADSKEFLIELYHKLFITIYGGDVVDAFTYVTKTNTKDLINKEYDVKALASNYRKAIEILKSLEDNPNNELLLIYLDNKLIGSAYLKRIDDNKGLIPFIAIDVVEKEIEREIWKETVLYIENYFNQLGYKKIYLEIPFKEGPLLIRANALGFKEDSDDINVDEVVYTYLLNKDLEGLKYVK